MKADGILHEAVKDMESAMAWWEIAAVIAMRNRTWIMLLAAVLRTILSHGLLQVSSDLHEHSSYAVCCDNKVAEWTRR